VLGVCLAAAGCQTSVVRNEPTYPPQGQIVSIMRPSQQSPTLLPSTPPVRITRSAHQQRAIGATAASQGRPLGNAPTSLTIDNPAQQPPPSNSTNRPADPSTVIEITDPGCTCTRPARERAAEFDKHSYPLYIIEPARHSADSIVERFAGSTGPHYQPCRHGRHGQHGHLRPGALAGLTIDQAPEAVAASWSAPSRTSKFRACR